jgi:DNA repair protein RadC
MKISPEEIKDIERLQRYERIFHSLLKNEGFSKPNIWACGESKGLIGRVINLLLDEGSIVQQEKGVFRWAPDSMEAYKKEWLASARSTHQVKRLRKEERPREKLLKYGASKLTTADLVAIFLRSGVKGKSAILIANELLTQFGGVKGIFEAEVNELLEIQGLGEAKVAQIKAVEALAEVYLKENIGSVHKIKSSKELFDYLYLTMRDVKREIFKVIYLDSANQVIGDENIFKGTLNASAVYPREVVEKAIQKKAASLIFAHNHPSGDPTPSESDKVITEDLIYACNLVEIKVLDHIIIGANKYFSFADEGLIEEYTRDFLSIKERRRR